MLLNSNYSLGIVKEVGNNDVVLDVDGKEVVLSLTNEGAQELQNYLTKQDNLLVPINLKTKELFLDNNEKWPEEEMKELIGAAKCEVDNAEERE